MIEERTSWVFFQVERLLARLSDRVSELTQVTAQGDNSALCAQLLVRTCCSLHEPVQRPPSDLQHGLCMCILLDSNSEMARFESRWPCYMNGTYCHPSSLSMLQGDIMLGTRLVLLNRSLGSSREP